MSERRNNTTHRRGVGQRSAEARRCPKCDRGAALVEVKPRPVAPGEVTTFCRWPDCNYGRIIPWPEAADPSSAHMDGGER